MKVLAALVVSSFLASNMAGDLTEASRPVNCECTFQPVVSGAGSWDYFPWVSSPGECDTECLVPVGACEFKVGLTYQMAEPNPCSNRDLLLSWEKSWEPGGGSAGNVIVLSDNPPCGEFVTVRVKCLYGPTLSTIVLACWPCGV